MFQARGIDGLSSVTAAGLASGRGVARRILDRARSAVDALAALQRRIIGALLRGIGRRMQPGVVAARYRHATETRRRHIDRSQLAVSVLLIACRLGDEERPIEVSMRAIQAPLSFQARAMAR